MELKWLARLPLNRRHPQLFASLACRLPRTIRALKAYEDAS